MSSRETKLANKFRELLIAAGCREEKLHGNMFQAGLPDLLIGLPDLRIVLIETKSTMRLYLTRGDVVGMLRPEQRRFFLQWRRFPIYALVFSGKGCSLLHADELFATPEWNTPLEWTEPEEVVQTLLASPSQS